MRKLPIALTFVLTITLVAGCLSKPDSFAKTGSLKLTVTTAESSQFTAQAVAADVRQLQIVLQKNAITFNYVYPFTLSDPNPIEITNIYPGEWSIAISGLDEAGDAIFYDTATALIESGKTTAVQAILRPAPGRIDVRFNASNLTGFGTTYTKATFYVYLDPAGSDGKSYELKIDGSYFQNVVTLPEGTYQAKLAIPNVSNGVYISPYFTINIQAGKTVQYEIAPDGSATLTGIIDSTPSTPQEVTAAYDRASNTVTLQWKPAADADLAGYNIYRTETDGRFKKLGSIAKTAQSYTENVAQVQSSRIGYTVSSYDAGGNESHWSEPVYITKN